MAPKNGCIALVNKHVLETIEAAKAAEGVGANVDGPHIWGYRAHKGLAFVHDELAEMGVWLIAAKGTQWTLPWQPYVAGSRGMELTRVQ